MWLPHATRSGSLHVTSASEPARFCTMSCAALRIRCSSGSMAKSLSMSSRVVTHEMVTERSMAMGTMRLSCGCCVKSCSPELITTYDARLGITVCSCPASSAGSSGAAWPASDELPRVPRLAVAAPPSVCAAAACAACCCCAASAAACACCCCCASASIAAPLSCPKPPGGCPGPGGGGGGHMGVGGALLPDGSPALPSDQSFGLRPGFGQQPQPPPPPPPGPGQPPGGFGQDKGAAMLALEQQQQAQAAALAAQQQQAAQAAAAQTLGGAATASLGTLGNSSLAGQAAPLDPALLAGQEQTVIPNLASYVVINSGLQLFTQQPQLKRIVPIAIDRSVTISCVTTRELMLKDFAMEPDEQRMRKAAQLMVQNLAGSLALVTCKEPLRVACGNHMRSLMQQ